MKTDFAFLNTEPGTAMVPVIFDGEEVHLPEGANLAAALMDMGFAPFRRTRGPGTARAPFCMMGVCFECLVEIEGITRQACLVEVTAGLVINPYQTGAGATDAKR